MKCSDGVRGWLEVWIQMLSNFFETSEVGSRHRAAYRSKIKFRLEASLSGDATPSAYNDFT